VCELYVCAGLYPLNKEVIGFTSSLNDKHMRKSTSTPQVEPESSLSLSHRSLSVEAVDTLVPGAPFPPGSPTSSPAPATLSASLSLLLLSCPLSPCLERVQLRRVKRDLLHCQKRPTTACPEFAPLYNLDLSRLSR